MITVGTTQRHYGAARNFLDAKVPGARFVRAGNIFRYPDYALLKAFNYIDPMLGNLQWGAKGVDLLHFFNTVSMGSVPWITTFETALPRWDYERPWAIPWGLKLMAGDPCRRLIAISECTANFQRSVMAKWPDLAAAIEPKITVLHPPQAALIEDKSEIWAETGPIRFAIVGALFFVKGGREILRAFDRLLARGLPLHLTIVSTLQFGDDETRSTRADQDEARRLIAKWPDAIVHRERLANPDVLDLFRRSHVALLPTWADTYGYSAVEAQAAGCPVITTDIRAMPEINNDSVGWVIPVPDDWTTNAVHIADHTDAQRARLSAALEVEIERILGEIAGDRSAIARKGAAALAKIRAEHCPEAFARALGEIYAAALA